MNEEVLNSESSIMIKGTSEIAEMMSHQIRKEKEYFGLEQNDKNEISIITQGISGIAQGYTKEN